MRAQGSVWRDVPYRCFPLFGNYSALNCSKASLCITSFKKTATIFMNHNYATISMGEVKRVSFLVKLPRETPADVSSWI